MLRLDEIKKDYLLKDQEPVHALRGITLNFRRNEFVAILGPSGCGKTTLLNIIGGLDQYSSGDLVIEGTSTKSYKDSDWDTYRNHSIGFVFQSYNLIPHQTLLQNVELALTIAGVSKQERRERAKNALKIVGLEGLEKKKPNQLSGGQMQRVAIARALVNNPEILLADEPTGALDSETSIQIMDLLKEVAKDRLVIMVTHNPDLANKYASRIVRMIDGLISDDSNPYSLEDEKKDLEEYNKNTEVKVNKGSKKKSSMSFKTAAGLSLSNLLAKLKRTILVMIAGSIGIIGVSTVLAVSHGVNNYIDDMQNDMLSTYPVSIEEESVDYTSLMTGLDNFDSKDVFEFDITTEVGLRSMINYLMSAYKGFTSTKTNEINEELVNYISKISPEDAALIKYNYGIDPTNNVFGSWNKDYADDIDVISLNGLTQRYIAELKTVEGFSEYASYVDLFTDFMQKLPTNSDYVLSQYELLANSTYATGEDEIMLVVGEDTTLTDLVLAQMGFYDHDEFLNIAKSAIKRQEAIDECNAGNITKEERDKILEELKEEYPYRRTFSFDELIGREFYYFPHDSIYNYGEIVSREYNAINVVLTTGASTVVTLQYNESNNNLTGVSLDLATQEYHIVYLQRQTEAKEIVNDEDVLVGSWVGIYGDMNHYMILNITDPNGSNTAWITDDIENFNPMTAVPTIYETQTTVTPTTENVTGYNYASVLTQDMIDNYENYGGVKLNISGILRRRPETNFGCLGSGVYYTEAFANRYMEDSKNSKILNDSITGFKDYIGSDQEKTGSFKAYVTFEYLDFSDPDNPVVRNGYASSLNGDLSSSFSDLFSSLTGVNFTEQDQLYFRSLSGLKATLNEETGNYEFSKLPKSIEIYPWDFDTKDHITDYLDKWNDNPNHKELTYTDTIELIATVIDALIQSITIALIVFTSLSLVVSCFMIAVITYISVMERVKEIGVIRSLGGRKKDVSRLFISETAIIGLLSGVFGIIITYILCIILNIIISRFNVHNIGDLTILTAIIMVSLSVFLNVISGLIPSMHASHEDPVQALRSE